MKRLLVLLSLLLATWASAPQAQTTRYVYLTPVDGSGAENSPYHSRCLGMPGKGNIDLRGMGINRFLCASDTLPADMSGVVQLGLSLTAELVAPVKIALNALAGKTLTATTVDGVIIELLGSRLRAGRDGKLKIYLGGKTPIYQQTAGIPFPDNGLFADVALGVVHVASVIEEVTVGATLAWAASIAEDFDCADHATSITCDLTWTNVTGTWGIVSNRAVRTATSTARIRAESAMATDDFEVSATLIDLTVTGTGDGLCAVMGRKDSGATATNYAFGANNSDGVSGYQIDKVIAGARTTLDTDPQDQVDNDLVKLRMNGSAISGLVNSTEIATVTDTDIAANTYGGIYATATTTTFSCTWDNWGAADYTPSRRRVAPWVY